MLKLPASITTREYLSDATLYFLYFNTDNDAMICDKRYLEVFWGGYCPLEHMKKSAPLNIPVMSKVMPVSFYLLKLPILPSFVIFCGSLRRIYLSAASSILLIYNCVSICLCVCNHMLTILSF